MKLIATFIYFMRKQQNRASYTSFEPVPNEGKITITSYLEPNWLKARDV